MLEAIAQGKGFVGFHSAADTFHSPGRRDENQTEVDPYIAMLGGEFLTHGKEQEASLLAGSPFLGRSIGVPGQGLSFTDEWCTFKNFAKDLHVVLVQETLYMKGRAYRRPDYPCTWARKHGQGRVFYTSMGHREDVWTNPFFQAIAQAGLEWVLGRFDADVRANIARGDATGEPVTKLVQVEQASGQLSRGHSFAPFRTGVARATCEGEIMANHPPVSRRDFIETGAMMLASAALGAKTPVGRRRRPQTRSYNENMDYRRLGRTGLMISAVSMGGHWKRIPYQARHRGLQEEPPGSDLRLPSSTASTTSMPAARGEVAVYAEAVRGRRKEDLHGL